MIGAYYTDGTDLWQVVDVAAETVSLRSVGTATDGGGGRPRDVELAVFRHQFWPSRPQSTLEALAARIRAADASS